MKHLLKKMVDDEIADLHDFETVKELIDFIKSSGYNPEFVKIKPNYGYYYLAITREETDEEFQKRIKPYTERMRKKEEEERNEYERLKAKFEGEK